MTAQQDVGGVNEREVEASFESAMERLQACVGWGVERVSFLSGEVTLAVQLGSGGELLSRWVRRSTLGDRPTELCMVNALGEVSWPPPIGGRTAEAEASFAFELESGERPPQVWDSGRARQAGAQLSEAAEACGAVAAGGTLVLTVYLDETGAALAAGAASRRPVDDEATDCLVDAALRNHYPSAEPGTGAAKLRLRL